MHCNKRKNDGAPVRGPTAHTAQDEDICALSCWLTGSHGDPPGPAKGPKGPTQVPTSLTEGPTGLTEGPKGPTEGPAADPAECSGVVLRATDCAQSSAVWLVDSGATKHMTGDAALLNNVKSCKGQGYEITFGNGNKLPVHGWGDALLYTSQGDPYYLKDVCYVPGIYANLFSSPAESRVNGLRFDMRHGSCKVYKGDKCIFNLPQQGSTYICYGAYPVKAMVAAVETADTWHRRFAHLGHENLAKLVQHGMVDGIGVTAAEFKAASIPGRLRTLRTVQANKKPLSDITNQEHRTYGADSHGRMRTAAAHNGGAQVLRHLPG